MKSLKISQTAKHKAGPQQASSIPSISAISVALSIMSEVGLISERQKRRHKRHAGFCHGNFSLAFADEAALCQEHAGLLSKLFIGHSS